MNNPSKLIDCLVCAEYNNATLQEVEKSGGFLKVAENKIQEEIEIYVRAQDPNGIWVTCNALDLDEESFKRLILDKLNQAEILFGLSTGKAKIPYRCTKTKEELDNVS